MLRVFFTRLALVFSVVSLGACANIMQEGPLVTAPSANKALVTVVRPSIFFGDAVNVYVWDNDQLIGESSSGTLFQYEADPGEHLFLGNAENWTYAKGTLEAGKSYVLKVNVFPGTLYARAALGVYPANDPRSGEMLKSLKSQVPIQEKNQAYQDKHQAEAVKAVNDFKSGAVTSFATIDSSDAQ